MRIRNAGALLAAGGAMGAGLPAAAQMPPQDLSSLRATLTSAPAKAVVGTPVTLTFTIINSGKLPLPITFASGKQFDMLATQAKTGKVVWQESSGMMYMMMVPRVTLAPGAKKVFTASWPLSPGTAAGDYTVRAFLTPTGELPFQVSSALPGRRGEIPRRPTLPGSGTSSVHADAVVRVLAGARRVS